MAARLFSRTLSALATLWAYLTRGVAETRFESLYVEELPESLPDERFILYRRKARTLTLRSPAQRAAKST